MCHEGSRRGIPAIPECWQLQEAAGAAASPVCPNGHCRSNPGAHSPCEGPWQPPASPGGPGALPSSPLVSPRPPGGSGRAPAPRAPRGSSSSASCAHGGQQRGPCTAAIPDRHGVIPAHAQRLLQTPLLIIAQRSLAKNLYFNRTQLGHLPFLTNSDFLFPSHLSAWVFETWFLSPALTALLGIPIPFPHLFQKYLSLAVLFTPACV